MGGICLCSKCGLNLVLLVFFLLVVCVRCRMVLRGVVVMNRESANGCPHPLLLPRPHSWPNRCVTVELNDPGFCGFIDTCDRPDNLSQIFLSTADSGGVGGGGGPV